MLTTTKNHQAQLFERQFDCKLKNQATGPDGYHHFTTRAKVLGLPFYFVVEFSPDWNRVYIVAYPEYRHRQPGEELKRTGGGRYETSKWLVSWN